MTTFQERIDQQTDKYDLIILSCGKQEEAKYWKKQLHKSHPAVITIVEDWHEGGAGNALGTLHAIEKAEEEGSFSPLSILRQGGKVALYHSAGKGTRMEPLTHAEGGMKAAIKLPAFLPDRKWPLSVLEMVIRQTAPLAALSKGRLSVFWTDQLFLPSSISWEEPTADVEVLAIAIPDLTKEMFAERKLSQYGIWGGDQYYDKLILKHFETLSPLDASINLGSFSISHHLLEKLLKGYKTELEERKGKLDSDPDWWMAATLPRDLYVQLKGEEKAARYERFKKMIGKAKVKPRILGEETDWWDFGTIDSYKKQLLKLLTREPESYRLRKLFGIEETDFIGDSLVFHSKLEHCTLKQSILLNMHAKGTTFEQMIGINTSTIHGHFSQGLLYGTSH